MELNRSDLNSCLCEEIEALEAILDESDELKLLPPNEEDLVIITVRIAPLTASDTSRQYVGLHLKMAVHKDNYPEKEIPRQIDVFQVRGMDEVKVENLLVILRHKSVEFEGMQVLFTLIDECREFLTAHNYPTCPCSICLFHIVEEDSFVKTKCYHYFHSTCFGRYLKYFKPISEEYEDDLSNMNQGKKVKKPENIIPCPVCRTDLDKNLFDHPDVLIKTNTDPILQPKNSEVLIRTQSLEDLQMKMKTLLENQQEKVASIMENR